MYVCVGVCSLLADLLDSYLSWCVRVASMASRPTWKFTLLLLTLHVGNYSLVFKFEFQS